MRDYFIRRALLIIPTIIGCTLIIFFITRIVPGGPIERAIAESNMVSMQGGGGGGGSDQALSEEQLQQLKEFYGLDKPFFPAYILWLGNVIRGDLGTSYRYQEPVTSMIFARMPISLYYGIMTTIITYVVCIPLGILKALQHKRLSDNLSSILIFAGYAIPGYALGAIMVVYLGARWEWFPMGGFTGPMYEFKGFFGKVGDILYHSVLPMTCYLISSFALMTMLMKNHLMDNLSADYVRTAVSKGMPFRDAVRKHALRNSMIPIATTLGSIATIFVTGSFLIEYIFDIDGIGLLGFTSIQDRDYPVVLGILVLYTFLILIGNILSDICVALVDPRVKFK